jgi:rod shape-determining protein MreC
MQNLIAFIWKYLAILVFLILYFFSILLIVQDSNFQRRAMVSSANEFSGSILQKWDDISAYFHLKTKNEYLALHNTLLMNRDPAAFIITDNAEFTTNDTTYRKQFTYQTAKVISNSTGKQNNYLIINKGRNQGIVPDQAALSPQGVVGIVKDVSDNFSSIISLLHSDARISAKVRRNGYVGTVIWDGKDYRYGKLIDIPYHLEVNIGDTIVTSGYSTVFPENVHIGTISEVKPNINDNFYDLKLQFFTDFNRVSQVYIVKNHFKAELDSLTSKFKK